MSTITFRDTIRAKSPTWLQIGHAQKLLYAVALQLDAFGDALVAGVKLRFPGLYTNESLPMIGRERRIRRGRIEPNSVYAVRLRRWLQDHQRRGGAYALLAQLYAYYAPAAFPIDLLYRSGRIFRMEADGDITRDYYNPHDVKYPQWARWFLLFYTDTYSDPPSAQDLIDLALIPREWVAGHIIGEILIMRTDTELWDYPPSRTWNRHVRWDHGTGTRIAV
jgi:hypothetical protein